MNQPDQNVDRVRQTLKTILQDSPWYLSRPLSEQVDIYRDLLVNGMEALQNGGLTRALAENGDLDPMTMRDVPELAGDFLDEVDFPQFVQELITGVYGSIVQSTIDQMMAYTEFFKQLAKPLGAIAQEIDEIDAKSEVAAGNPLRFTMTPGGDLQDNDAGGMTIDESNDEYQRLLFEARLKLARERRLILRETLLMGVQRLIVTDGTIRASLVFNVKSTEASQIGEKTTDIQREGGQYGGSFFGLFGGGSNKRRTKISVTSRQIQRNTELAASITGYVEVKFRSDVFELNNFAQVFAGENALQQLQEGQAQRAQNGGQPAGQPNQAANR